MSALNGPQQPLIAPGAGVFETGGFWQHVAALAAAVTAFAEQRAIRLPVEDLTARLRQPYRWALRHPVRAFRRRLR